jgi:hypothetical protein
MSVVYTVRVTLAHANINTHCDCGRNSDRESKRGGKWERECADADPHGSPRHGERELGLSKP